MRTTGSFQRGAIAVSMLAVTALVAAGCSGGSSSGGGDSSGDGANPVTLSVATSQNEQTPNYFCGVELLKERLEGADIGFTVDLFPASQLGPDADRLPMIQGGDIDIDLQGPSAMGATFEPIGVLEAAYAFDDVDHAFEWIDNDSEELFTQFQDATGVKVVDGWFYGNRTFTTKGVEVRHPDDLAGKPIRFPNSPTYLANAAALGVTNPASIAFEEIYTALQQGIAVGQENPIAATHSSSYDEVLDTAILNNHQVSIHLVVVSEKTYEKLNEEQIALLEKTIHEIRPENRACVDEETEEVLEGYRADPNFTVIEPEEIDIDAFREGAEEYFMGHFTGESLEAYESIRATAAN